MYPRVVHQGVLRRVYRLEVLQDQVAGFGLNTAQVTQLAASVLDGRYLGKYRHVGEEIDLKLLFGMILTLVYSAEQKLFFIRF